MPDSGRRLTSWKEIAAYLGREVRTVMRWEKARALPVHRGSGARAGVVFAETSELDAWMRGTATPIPLPSPAPVSRPATLRWLFAIGAALALAAAGGGWRVRGALPNEPGISAVMTEHAVIARHADGTEKWRYEFTAATASPPFARATNPIEPLGREGLLAATSNTVRKGIPAVRSGQLLWFDAAGALTRSFSFEDDVTIGSRVYTAPWSISDFQVNGGGASRRIAIASSHFEWWPSLVTILDGQWRRTGTFAHAGWIEHLRWLTEDRLLVTGFSNLKDGGMAAILDANALTGQSPADPGSAYDCSGCGPHRPLRYVVMPRSEVNRVSGAPFNRADVTVKAGGVVVRTTEVRETPYAPPAEALYEFTSQLDLAHASYSDRYWEAHRELERIGKLAHARERCPDREGPPTIEIWDPVSGWRVQSLRPVIDHPAAVTTARLRGR